MTFYAHSANKQDTWQTQAEHLGQVAKLARVFAAAFGRADEARLCGLLHDLGKYADRFQARLKGDDQGLDHWSAGAWVALRNYQSVAAALAIQGHHIGLQQATREDLKRLAPAVLESACPARLQLSSPDVDLLMERLRADRLPLESPPRQRGMLTHQTHAGMLDVRMLFSALVDADYLDTAGHFEAPAGREHGPKLRPHQALAILEEHLRGLSVDVKASDEVRAVRADLLGACRDAAEGDPGLWTLSAPTGSGKTLAMLAFALAHAARHRLRRIVFVVPYLSIIEQTAEVYRALFEPHFGPHYVLEHHSLAGIREAVATATDAEQVAERQRRQLSENWDAPLIITTSVQLLESLFSNRPSACRKLHRLARSVILFDEVQTLPLKLALPTLAGLGRLASDRYRSSVVFATATQPAFGELNEPLKARSEAGWWPREIAPPGLELFRRAARTCVQWPEPDEVVTWDEVRDWLLEEPQALCIVNMRRHARDLALTLNERGAEGVFHLSTAMCPRHRKKVLDEVRRRLEAKEPCRLIATQCIEAGVDVDFPRVFRALGPLESVAQAAGRCNRRGLDRMGWVRVFVPRPTSKWEWLYPGNAYRQAADVTWELLREYGPDRLDIHAPAVFKRYYRRLYGAAGVDSLDRALQEGAETQCFVTVAKEYRLIEEDGINVLVPYAWDEFAALVDRLGRYGLSRTWMADARALTVACHTPRKHDPLFNYVQAARLADGSDSTDWYVALATRAGEVDFYDELVGMNPPAAAPFWCV